MKKLAMIPAARIAVSAAVLMNGKGKMFRVPTMTA